MTCQHCHRVLAEGETAWASDWRVIGPGGVRSETRYTCETCEDQP